MRKLTFAALALAFAAAATAQTAPSPVPAALPPGQGASLNPTDSPAGAYQLDARHVAVIWRVRHLGMSLYTARFDTVSGTLNWNPRDPAQSSLNVTIAANSVSTGLVNDRGERAFDREIASQVLGAEANPNITFVSRAITRTGPTTGLITGDLTMRGVTRPVTLEAAFEGGRFVAFSQRNAIGFSGRTIIRRSDFGANLSNALANGAAGDEVEVLIQVEFLQPVQQQAPAGGRR